MSAEILDSQIHKITVYKARGLTQCLLLDDDSVRDLQRCRA